MSTDPRMDHRAAYPQNQAQSAAGSAPAQSREEWQARMAARQAAGQPRQIRQAAAQRPQTQSQPTTTAQAQPRTAATAQMQPQAHTASTPTAQPARRIIRQPSANGQARAAAPTPERPVRAAQPAAGNSTAPPAAAPVRATSKAAPAPAPVQASAKAAPAPVKPAPMPAKAAPSPASQATRPTSPPVAKRRKKKKRLHPALLLLLTVGRTLLFIFATAVKVAALALIPLFLFWYTYTVDRNGWFQGEQYEREIALAMLDGEAISNFGQMEEREITKLYVQNLNEAPSSIAIGSSRILQLNRALMQDETFFNAGMIGAEYPDVMDSYYLFDRVDLTPETVIFGVDPWLFSAGVDANTFKRVDMQMYNEFLRYGLGHTDVEVTAAVENMNFWLALTSPAFFHETMDYYIDNKENGLRPSIVQGDPQQEVSDCKMPDGSVVYGSYLRDQTQEDINNGAYSSIMNVFVNCEEFYELDAEHCELFDEFIRYMQRKGSNVVFLLSPYHPITYEVVLQQPERYSGFFAVETWLRSYAAQHGIPVYGSYDPLAAGCDETDFFDAWHIRGSGIAKFFPGLPAIESDRAAGTLPDPLAVQPRLPSDETDADTDGPDVEA